MGRSQNHTALLCTIDSWGARKLQAYCTVQMVAACTHSGPLLALRRLFLVSHSQWAVPASSPPLGPTSCKIGPLPIILRTDQLMAVEKRPFWWSRWVCGILHRSVMCHPSSPLRPREHSSHFWMLNNIQIEHLLHLFLNLCKLSRGGLVNRKLEIVASKILDHLLHYIFLMVVGPLRVLK